MLSQYLLYASADAAEAPASFTVRACSANALDPSDPQPHYLLAQTYRDLHQPQESDRELA